MAIGSLGMITVDTPGTPVRITSNQAIPGQTISCNAIMLQTLSTSAGNVYIGNATMNKTTMSGVFAVLPIPTANSLPAFSMGNPTAMAAFNAAEIYIDATASGIGVIASIVR